MDAILLFSHGSVLCGAERNLIDLASTMRQRGDAPIVEVGFLNYSEPSFAEAVSLCVRQGATRIVIAPYFLVSGKFVVQDLPQQIEAARAAHPSIELETAGVIGFHTSIADAILQSAATARAPRSWREQIGDMSQWCRRNPKCPMHGSEGCLA